LLLELRVKDFGIIEDIEWKLDRGLNVITGETGAGKSLIIDAVELLLIGTASEDVIRHGADEAWIEGGFALPDSKRSSSLKAFLCEKGLASEEGALIINCEVRKQRPGVVRINGHSVTKSLLRQMGALLVDIHGQSQHLSLLDPAYHLDFLDAYAHTFELRNNFSAGLRQFREAISELQLLEKAEKDHSRQEELLQYEIDEIEKARLEEGEDEGLEKERLLISQSEKLKEYAGQIYAAIAEGGASPYSSSALFKLNQARQALKKLAAMDPSLSQHLDLLEKSIYGMEELARDIHLYADKLHYDPKHMEEIESRLELLRHLKRKYGKTIPDILAYLEKAQGELSSLGYSSERRLQLEQESADLKKRLGQLASELSQKRTRAASQLMADVKKELRDLDMSQMRFAVAITQTPSPEGISGPEGTLCSFGDGGIDSVEFMASTNPGEPLKPLARIASTGEISRFTLALKGTLSEADDIPVLIFDEIDIGVGGRSGEIIGKKLWNLARSHQVICVTHLPQIAAYADAHYCVQKRVSGPRATSTLANLTGDLRLQELATMLAGPNYSATALKNAFELLQKAEAWKNSP
jgi:DNA repair protein RecN (Recombination protein N)